MSVGTQEKMTRSIAIVNGQPILAAWLPGEADLIAELARLDWCKDYNRVRDLGLRLVAIRTGVQK